MSTPSAKIKFLAPVIFTALLGAGCNQAANTPANNTPPASPTSPSAQQPPAAASQKFIDQSYYKNAYLISGDTLSADAKTALTGFSLGKQTMADGSTKITLTALKAGYHDQQYTLKPGDQLYFIEKFLGDDKTETNEEQNPMDDSAVVVDSQGNVVGQPQGWTPGTQ